MRKNAQLRMPTAKRQAWFGWSGCVAGFLGPDAADPKTLNSTASKRRNDGGFTITEAMVALLVLSLAMTQLTNLIGQYLRATIGARTDIASSTRVLKNYRLAKVSLKAKAETVIKIGDHDFDLAPSPATQTRQCFFDAVGRRCR